MHNGRNSKVTMTIKTIHWRNDDSMFLNTVIQTRINWKFSDCKSQIRYCLAYIIYKLGFWNTFVRQFHKYSKVHTSSDQCVQPIEHPEFIFWFAMDLFKSRRRHTLAHGWLVITVIFPNWGRPWKILCKKIHQLIQVLDVHTS